MSSSAAGSARKCVNCNAKLRSHARICIRCGVDQTTGQRISEELSGHPRIDAEDAFETEDLRPEEHSYARSRTARLSHGDDAEVAFASRGMRCLEVGLFLSLLSFLLLVVAIIVAAADALVRTDLEWLGGIVGLGGIGLFVIGLALLLGVPRAAGARGFLIAALACIVVAIVAGAFTDGLMSDTVFGLICAVVGGVLTLAGMLLFVIFLKELSDFLAFGDIGHKADTLSALIVAVAIGQFALFNPILSLIVFGFTLVALGLYLSLMVDLYRAAQYRRVHGTG
ncbi:MAG: hypothetical protein AAF328_09845 [Planctomycetota bacterium]